MFEKTTDSLHSFDSLEYECGTHTITRRACKRVAKLYYGVVKRIDPDKTGASIRYEKSTSS